MAIRPGQYHDISNDFVCRFCSCKTTSRIMVSEVGPYYYIFESICHELDYTLCLKTCFCFALYIIHRTRIDPYTGSSHGRGDY